jgi:hypothetical protein
MLHARSLGESFGVSCAEFAIKNKPILLMDIVDKELILKFAKIILFHIIHIMI